MTPRLLVVKNCAHEGAGLFETVLHEERVRYDIADLDAGDTFPSHDGYAALLVMGGPDSANDDNVKMRTELLRIQNAMRDGIPCFGVCLGLQTLVKACGGTVRKSETKEIGLRDPEGAFFSVEITEDGKADPLLRELDASLPIFHLHGETVEMTPEMTLLATGRWCRNQIVKVRERAYGMQGHWDVTPQSLRVWMEKDADLAHVAAEQLLDDWNEIEAQHTAIGRTIFQNFLAIAGFPPSKP